MSSLHIRQTTVSVCSSCYVQGDHSLDNVKFPDGSWHSSVALGMLSVTHTTSTKYLYARKYAAYNKQFEATFPLQDLFPDISLTFSKIPDISRFSRQVPVVTIYVFLTVYANIH